MKKALIIGASSGIGRALAVALSKEQYELGLMSRRTEKLETLQKELSTPTYIGYVDVTNPDEAIKLVDKMLDDMNGVDLIILNAGTGFLNIELDWSKDEETIKTNVLGFSALAGLSYKYFAKQGHGHLVGISSIAALRGGEATTAYNASKAFMSNYLEGLRKKAYKQGLSIIVTDIMPGFVDTDLVKGSKTFWMATPEKAAEQIVTAIKKGKSQAYITRRWRLIGWLLKIIPERLFLMS